MNRKKGGVTWKFELRLKTIKRCMHNKNDKRSTLVDYDVGIFVEIKRIPNFRKNEYNYRYHALNGTRS